MTIKSFSDLYDFVASRGGTVLAKQVEDRHLCRIRLPIRPAGEFVCRGIGDTLNEAALDAARQLSEQVSPRDLQ